jgi:hypothetical protein
VSSWHDKRVEGKDTIAALTGIILPGVQLTIKTVPSLVSGLGHRNDGSDIDSELEVLEVFKRWHAISDGTKGAVAGGLTSVLTISGLRSDKW